MEQKIISMTTEEFKSLVDAYCIDRKKPTSAQELIYLGEVQDRCPKCGKPLVRQGTRRPNKDFEIAHIFPCNPTPDDMAVLEGVELYGQNSETMDNKIALCHDCHEDYDNNKTKEKYEYFLNLKKRLSASYQVQMNVAQFNIEQELKDVISRLSSFTSKDIPDTHLDFNAKTISEKIDETKHFSLKDSIEHDVRTYFVFIQKEIEYYCKQSNADIEMVALAFKGSYLKCKQKSLGVEETFSTLTSWVKTKVGCSETVAHILVSYFVQNCEVYEKLP